MLQRQVKRLEFQLEMPQNSCNEKNKRKTRQVSYKCLKAGKHLWKLEIFEILLGQSIKYLLLENVLRILIKAENKWESWNNHKHHCFHMNSTNK